MTATAEIQNASVAELHASTPQAGVLATAVLEGFGDMAKARVDSLGTKGCSQQAAQAAMDLLASIQGPQTRMEAALAQFAQEHGQPATGGANLANLATQNTGVTTGRG